MRGFGGVDGKKLKNGLNMSETDPGKTLGFSHLVRTGIASV